MSALYGPRNATVSNYLLIFFWRITKGKNYLSGSSQPFKLFIHFSGLIPRFILSKNKQLLSIAYPSNQLPSGHTCVTAPNLKKKRKRIVKSGEMLRTVFTCISLARPTVCGVCHKHTHTHQKRERDGDIRATEREKLGWQVAPTHHPASADSSRKSRSPFSFLISFFWWVPVSLT